LASFIKFVKKKYCVATKKNFTILFRCNVIIFMAALIHISSFALMHQ